MKSAIRAYEGFFGMFAFLKHPLLLLMRLYWGYLFLMSGWGKLTNIHDTISFFEQSHIYFPAVSAWATAIVETVGGFCLIIGFMSRFWAFALTIVMIVAYITVHWAAVAALGSDPSQFVAQAPFLFLLTCLLVLIFGPGIFSIDYFLRRRWQR